RYPPSLHAALPIYAPRSTERAALVIHGKGQHRRQLAQRPTAFAAPAVERRLHRGLVTLAAGRPIDDALRLQCRDHVIVGDEGILAGHAQEAWRGEPAQLASVPGDMAPQPDDVLGRPVGEQMTEAALLLRHVQHELRVAWHALELAEMADQLRVLHQSFDMLAPHQHDLLRIEAEEGLLEGRPLGIDQTMLENGATDS